MSSLQTPSFAQSILSSLIRFVLLPGLIYFISFCLLTYPLITHFDSAFMGDSQDVYQNVWSLWWFSQAMDNPAVDLWHTTMLYYPQGASLYIHALSPLNGALAYPLHQFLPWHQVYNSLIVFNFVVSGVSLFWLAYYYTKAWFPSLAAGWLFTFSAYHFFHSRGHIEMASMQWLTLFFLSFIWLLDSPSWKKAVGAAGLLALTLWNTPYHFIYALLVGVVLVSSYLVRYRNNRHQLKRLIKPLLVFIANSLLLLGPALFQYYRHSTGEPLSGTHDPKDFSTEVFHYFARPSGFFGEATKAYWPEVLENPDSEAMKMRVSPEASVRLGIAALFLAVLASVKYLKKDSRIQVWLSIGLLFFVFSLGPELLFQGETPVIGGQPVHLPLPYVLLDTLVPSFKSSGVPARMGIIPLMAVCLLVGFGLRFLQKRKAYVLIAILLVVAVLEAVPKPITPLEASVPEAVTYLAQQPTGVLLDRAQGHSLAMYYQVFHRKPLIDGYLSRVTRANYDYSRNLVIGQHADTVEPLCRAYQVKYLWTAIPIDGLESVMTPKQAYVYDLQPGGVCMGQVQVQ